MRYISPDSAFSPEASETCQFRNRSRYPEVAFSDALKTHVGIENSRITIRSIIARAVAREFDGWRNLADAKEGALISAGRYLATLGASFPRLDDLPTDTDFQPESCTFAYDPESPFVDMAGNEQVWLHQTVAVCAGRLRRDVPGIDPSSSDFARELASSVVTRQNNGLYWLFGNGLRYLRTDRNQGSRSDARSAQAKTPQGTQGAAEAEPHLRRNGRTPPPRSHGWKQT